MGNDRVTLESNIEQEVVAWATNHGWYPKKMVTPGRRGTADHYFHGWGQIIIIEFKRPGELPDPLQIKEHKKLLRHGIEVFVVDNTERGIRILKALMP